MRRALALRPLTGGEIRQLKVGRCSAKGMTVRRSQILLASAAGHSPTQIASVVGCNPSTVTHVISDFHDRGIVSVHEERRQPGARRRGRLRIEEREPGITVALEQLLADEIAGDPMGRASWVRSSLRRLRDALGRQGYRVDHCTIRKLLKKMGFTLKRNQKRRGGVPEPRPRRAIPLHRRTAGGVSLGGLARHQHRYQAKGADRQLPELGTGLAPRTARGE